MKREQEFEELIEDLRASGALVLVEGNKDRNALLSLGISNILTLKKPLHDVVENIAENHKEVILLTDLDKEGKQLYGRLNSGLQKYGVKVNNKLRDFLLKNTKLRQIEGLRRYADAL